MTTRKCPACNKDFALRKPSSKQIYCGHKCAFSVIGEKVRRAASTPEALKKRGDVQRGKGIGYVKLGGRHEHRVVVEKLLGRRLKSTEIVHHKDENKQNNNPSNLVIVNAATHAKIHFSKPRQKKTHCQNGHEFTPENTRVDARGFRSCKTCFREYDRKWKKEKRDANRKAKR